MTRPYSSGSSAAGGDPDSWRYYWLNITSACVVWWPSRTDPRLQGRFDPSDVLQDVYLEAIGQLDDYLRSPGLPFFLWLRALTGHRLARLHRHHLGTQRRDAGREVSADRAAAPEVSSAILAEQPARRAGAPSEEVARRELREHLQALLERLSADDRDVLALRHFEQLNTAETAQVLDISEAAAGKRYVRA